MSALGLREFLRNAGAAAAGALIALTAVASTGSPDLYHERLRPQFHFSSRRGWINDPNGLVYYRGEYHLFYQHVPFATTSIRTEKHWGHAVSVDLVHWRELGDALAPDALGAIYSGSAVVDWTNSSGFGTRDSPAQVLIYTAAGSNFGQCLAYSSDGRTYTKYAGNPVLSQIQPGNRDPKVVWYAPAKRWIMSLYVGPRAAKPDARGRPAVTEAYTIQFLASKDLKHWTALGSTPMFFECPNLFELPLDGDPTRKKWILTDASSDYMVGEFGGQRFASNTPKLQGHSGPHISFYAGQVFSDLPRNDGRCIQMGWLTAPSPGMSFNQALSLPMELRLVTTPAGPRLAWNPVRELERLREHSLRLGPTRIEPGQANPFAGFKGELIELRAEFTPGTAERVVFVVRGVPVVYDTRRQEVVAGQHGAAAPLIGGRQSLSLWLDRTTLEVFASEGLTYVPLPVIADPTNQSLIVSTEGGAATFSVLEAHRLRSIWEQ